jgi:hypothetical protein
MKALAPHPHPEGAKQPMPGQVTATSVERLRSEAI